MSVNYYYDTKAGYAQSQCVKCGACGPEIHPDVAEGQDAARRDAAHSWKEGVRMIDGKKEADG